MKLSLKLQKLSSLIKKGSGQTVINVDIQPEYEPYIGFNISNWIEYLNQNYLHAEIVFLYNGPDLGMVSELDYKNWLLEHGAEIDMLESAQFFDKGYAFFRYCMDEGVPDDEIVDLVQFMIKNNINDSRDIKEEHWEEFTKLHNPEYIRELLEFSSDLINIPDLMDYLKRFHNIILTGGGINECLKEVEIALMALGKNYTTNQKYTY